MGRDGNGVGCPCEAPEGRSGYCIVRKREMAAHHMHLCRTDPRYRDAFNGPKDRPHRRPPGGPGTELTKMLRTFGFTYTATCQCKSRARQMDRWGPDVCLKNMDTIMLWFKEEAAERKLPFWGPAAKGLVKMAIYRSRKTH